MWSTLQDFYRSPEWEKFREVIIAERINQDDGTLYSEYSGRPLVNAYDIILHHKTELTLENVNDYRVSLNPDNIMVVSHAEHNQIHERFGSGRRTVYLVYGPPCSGKTSWVNSVVNPDDLVLDVDALWSAVCLAGSAKPSRLKRNIFGLRDCMLDQIKTRLGDWRHAYVITTERLPMQRERLIISLGAEPIYINTPKDVCLSRLAESPDGRDQELYRKLIEDFFRYNPETIPPTSGI